MTTEDDVDYLTCEGEGPRRAAPRKEALVWGGGEIWVGSSPRRPADRFLHNPEGVLNR